MKKISYILIAIFLLINIVSCTGYKPIFSSSNLQFKIVDFSLSGNTELSNKIYSKLSDLSRMNKETAETKKLYAQISISKNKNATAKDSAGKILGYRVSLSSSIIITDVMNGNRILNENYTFSSTYKVQDEFTETLDLENTTTENLINKIYESILIVLSEKIT